MEQIVSGCKDCPYRDEIEREILDDDGDVDEILTQYYCNHPKRYLVDLWDGPDGIQLPSDCPLLSEPITITLKEDNNG